MHDAIEFEKRGIPAANITTEQFVHTAKAVAEVWGLPDYPFVVIPHPLGSLEELTLRERAAQAAPGVVQILTEGKLG